MSRWSAVEIGDVTRIIGGGTPMRSNRSYYDGDIPWVTPKDMKKWYIDGAQITITESGLKNSAARLAPTHSVLIVVRSGVLKHTIPVAINRLPVAINQDMKALICDDSVHAAYLARFIKWRSNEILQWVRATTADNFPIDNLKGLRMPLPPVAEQRRIAHVLDSVDALRAKRSEGIALLDDLAQSIFFHTFGDSTTNPKGWKAESLGNLARVVRGASPRPKGDPKYFGGPIPWLMISDVTRSAADTVTQINEGVTSAGRDKSVYLKAGTLVLTNSATVGIPKFLGVDACIHDGFLAILDISKEIDSMYLYQFFKQNRDKITSLAPEGTQKNLNTRIAKALSVPVPPLAIQHAFRRSMDQINLLRSGHHAQLTMLEALLASLQPRAFRGELWDSPAA